MAHQPADIHRRVHPKPDDRLRRHLRVQCRHRTGGNSERLAARHLLHRGRELHPPDRGDGPTATPGTEDCHATGRVDPTHAIYQDTTNVNNGTRLLVAADGNIWITGHLNYRVDPRGPDDIFSDPIPGDASGTSADDQLDVQNVLGIVSWATPSPWVPASRSGGIRLSSALTGDLDTHGMIFAANLSGRAEPSGQFAFDDPDGSFRGDFARTGRRRPEDHGGIRSGIARAGGTDGTGCTTSASGTRRCHRRLSPSSRASPRRRRSASTATPGASASSTKPRARACCAGSTSRWRWSLAALLLSELTRSRQPAPSAPSVSEGPPVVAQETAGPAVPPHGTAPGDRGSAAPAA